MSGIQECSPKSEFVSNRPINQMELPGPNITKQSIMIGSMRPPIPFSKGQPMLAKVVQTPMMGQQAPNILVVGQSRMAQPNANLLVPGGGAMGSVASGLGGFIVGGNVVGDKSGSTIIGNLQQTQQLQQAQQQLLQQQQPHQPNILNSLVTLSGMNMHPANNQPGSMIGGASVVSMEVPQHNMICGTSNLQNRIIRNQRLPTVLDSRSNLQSVQSMSTRSVRPNVVPLPKPNPPHQFQVSSSSPPSSIHMVAMAAPSSLAGGANTYVVPNPSQRVILSNNRAAVPQLQRPQGSGVAIRQSWPAQIIPQPPALLSSSSASSLGSYPIRSIISTSFVEAQQRSMSVQPVRPVPIQQQATSRTILSPSLTSPINLSINTIISSASSVSKNIVLGQNQALNLTQPLPRQPTVILAPTSITKTTAPTVAPQQVGKIISQSPLNLTKRKVKLQSSTSSAYSTLTPATTLRTGLGGIPIMPTIGAMPIQSTVVPVAKVIPQMHIVNSGSQQIQLHQIHVHQAQQQQSQQAHLVAGSGQGQLRTSATSEQAANLLPLQSANAMLIGGGLNLISPGSLPASTVLHADKSHLLHHLSISDGGRFLTSQGTHLLSQNQLGLGGLSATVQTITIPASATLRPPNSGNIPTMTSSLSLSSPNMTSQVNTRMQPMVLSIDSGAQALQNFALVAGPTMVAAVGSDCGAATDLSHKDAALHHHQQQIQTSTALHQHHKHALHHQFVSLALPLSTAEPPASALYNNTTINNNITGSASKTHNQSPRPPSILRKRTHDSSSSATKKNLFMAPASSMVPVTMGAATTFASSSTNLYQGGGHLTFFHQNLPSQLHAIQQQQQNQQQQLFLHQAIGSGVSASDVVVKFNLGGNEGGLQLVMPTTHQTFDVTKDSSQSSTDTASSTENTPKPSQSLPSDMNRSCKVNVVASSNGALRVSMETAGSKEEEVKMHSRKKPRKQQLVAQTTATFPSNDIPPQKEVAINDAMTDDDDDDNLDDGMDDLPFIMPGSEECSVEDVSRDVMVEKEFKDKNGVRWSQEKQRSCALITNQYQCLWKPRNNHFMSYNDFKLKDERKSSISELSNQRCILQRISGYKLYLISDHLNLLKDEEKEVIDCMSDLKQTLTKELQNLNMAEEFQSTNELIMAYTQRSKKCIEQLEESKNSLLKLLKGRSKANEIVSKHQSKRVVKKKDRS